LIRLFKLNQQVNTGFKEEKTNIIKETKVKKRIKIISEKKNKKMSLASSHPIES